jgi:predicted nuclease with TOPRIM domain
MTNETLTIEEIIPAIEKVKNTIVTLKAELDEKQRLVEEKENEIADKEKEIVEREIKLNQAAINQQQLENEYAYLETEFKKISELFSEISEKEEVTLDVKQLLGIYIALLEKVFAGKPHAKILYILHGNKSEMSREELTKTTGFTAAIVLHSLHELNRADLISYDEEEGKATLVNRIY